MEKVNVTPAHAIIGHIKQLEAKRGRVASDVYSNGNCGQIYYYLKQWYRDAKPYLIHDNVTGQGHIITDIGNGTFFDIQGPVELCECGCMTQRPLKPSELKELAFNYSYNQSPYEGVGEKKYCELKEKEYLGENLAQLREYLKLNRDELGDKRLLKKGNDNSAKPKFKVDDIVHHAADMMGRIEDIYVNEGEVKYNLRILNIPSERRRKKREFVVSEGNLILAHKMLQEKFAKFEKSKFCLMALKQEDRIAWGGQI